MLLGEQPGKELELFFSFLFLFAKKTPNIYLRQSDAATF